MKLLTPTRDVDRARQKWQYTGKVRPPFAEEPAANQESVWDFPRPPRIEPTAKALRVEFNGTVIAATTNGKRVLETSGAPTYYFPPQDVAKEHIHLTDNTYHCEWKGISQAFATADVTMAGWLLTQIYPEFSCLSGWYAFYPMQLRCFVEDERANAQPGGYYGGWVTSSIVGPIKGEAGNEDW